MARVDPRYAYAAHPGGYATYRPDYYGMQTMPPPPVYDPRAVRPPVYDGPGPEGATKIAVSQWGGEPPRRPQNDDVGPPPGPPPPAVQANNTGSSNNPYRQ